jgi:hypothetical protein
MSTVTQKASTKRITKVVVKRMLDESPDTSWMGEYGNRAESEYAIDRAHDEDCPSFQGDSEDCTCNFDGHWSLRSEYRYFNGPVENYKGESPENIRKYIREDYERMESLNRGDFSFIGIRAEAQVHLTGDLFQEITSGGLWGIESDSGESCLQEIEQEQLSELRAELEAIGFSKRAVSAAFRNIQHSE